MFKFTAVLRAFIVGVLLVFAGPAAAQQAYPSRPIRIIVPYPPAGSADLLVRLVGQKLSESWSQQVIVDNRPGGNTIIATQALVNSRPDGYTILLTTPTHVLNGLLLPNLPFDSLKDFAPVATLVSTELVLVVNQAVPANNLQEFISLAKSKPGQLNYAIPATGGVIHLASELFNISAGVKMQAVPYKGAAPSITDLIAGQVQSLFQVPSAVIPQIKSGKLKAIAVSGEIRLAALPQVPTLAEAGLPGVEMKFWNGLVAPAGTPAEIIDKLAAEIARILAMPDIRGTLASQGIEPFISTPDQFAALLKADLAKFARIIKAADIKPES